MARRIVEEKGEWKGIEEVKREIDELKVELEEKRAAVGMGRTVERA